MQLLLILSILFGVLAVMFALQNNAPVTVAFGLWSFESSLALVLILTLGMGALVASLLSTPAVIRNQSAASRLRRKLAELEKEKLALEQRVRELDPPPAQQERSDESVHRHPYVGLRSVLLHHDAQQH